MQVHGVRRGVPKTRFGGRDVPQAAVGTAAPIQDVVLLDAGQFAFPQIFRPRAGLIQECEHFVPSPFGERRAGQLREGRGELCRDLAFASFPGMKTTSQDQVDAS